MEKILKKDCRSFDITNGITIEEFNEKCNKIISKLKDKYGYITDVKIHTDCGRYNDGEDYFADVNIIFKRYETDEELMLRTNLAKMRKTEQEERELKLLRYYMETHKDEAIKYMKELNLI